jgi:hypothetical protein
LEDAPTEREAGRNGASGAQKRMLVPAPFWLNQAV